MLLFLLLLLAFTLNINAGEYVRVSAHVTDTPIVHDSRLSGDYWESETPSIFSCCRPADFLSRTPDSMPLTTLGKIFAGVGLLACAAISVTLASQGCCPLPP